MAENIQLPDEQGLVWHSVDEGELTGFAWYDQDKVYRRLPVNATEVIPPAVNNLAWNCSGGKLRFITASKRVFLRYELRSDGLMDHIPHTGQSGFDIYMGKPGKEHFFYVIRTKICQTNVNFQIVNLPKEREELYTLNFPLYNGVNHLEIGLDAGAEMLRPEPLKHSGYIAVYGTSITQGGCASRPGMGYTNILSRLLQRHVYNYGFSGAGKGEPEMARLLAQLDPTMYLLDFEANCNDPATYKVNLPRFISILREAHPTTPILVASRIKYSNIQREDTRKKNFAMQSKLVKQLRLKGDRNIFFIDGGKLLGKDFAECTVDGVHATDLGFYRMAHNMAPIIKKILG